MTSKDTRLWIGHGLLLLIGAALLTWDFVWMRDYAATVSGDIQWGCVVGTCATNDLRSLIPAAGWAIVVIVAVGWLFLPGVGFMSGVAFLVFAGAFAAGYTKALDTGLATNGTRVQAIVAACIGVVLMILGAVLTVGSLAKERRRRLGNADAGDHDVSAR
ncbi:MAG: hypothetical protein ACTMIK_05125 [Galactobacter sp.]